MGKKSCSYEISSFTFYPCPDEFFPNTARAMGIGVPSSCSARKSSPSTFLRNVGVIVRTRGSPETVRRSQTPPPPPAFSRHFNALLFYDRPKTQTRFHEKSEENAADVGPRITRTEKLYFWNVIETFNEKLQYL